jgi:hypothetical protein
MMGMLDNLLGQTDNGVDVANLAAKVGLTPEQVSQAVAALAAAHTQDGDTANAAATQTGLPVEALQQIIVHLGGEGALGRFAALVGGVQGNTQTAEPGADHGIEGLVQGLGSKILGNN